MAVCMAVRCRAFSIFCRTSVLLQKNEEKLSAILLKLKKPKRPASSFLKFLSKNRNELMEKYPEKATKEIAKLASKIWSELPKEEKSLYVMEHNMELQDYQVQMKKYVEQVNAFGNQKLLADMKSFTEKEKVLMGKPVRPGTPFFLFRKELIKDSKGSSLPVAKVKEKWSSCGNNEKQVFENEYKKLWQKYEKALIEWEKLMYSKGYTQLIRRKMLKQLKESHG